MQDIEPGCEPVLEQLKRWTGALMAKDFDVLEEVLSPDFQFTVDTKFSGGRMNKAEFIAFDKKISECQIDLLKVTARWMSEDMITTLILAHVSEELEGDLGPGMPSAAEMKVLMKDAKLAYASGWRHAGGGKWQCFNHHIFGFLN